MSSTAAFGGRWVRLAKEGQQAAGVFVEVGKGVTEGYEEEGPNKDTACAAKGREYTTSKPLHQTLFVAVYLSFIVTQHLVPHQPSCKWGRGGGYNLSARLRTKEGRREGRREGGGMVS